MAVNLGPKIPIMVSAASGDTYLTQGNAMLRALQPLLVANVINITTTTPPTTPSNGDTYIVAAGATDAWAGYAQSIAYWSTDNLNTPSGEWEFYTPVKGWIVGNQADGAAYIFGGAVWGTVGGGGTQLVDRNAGQPQASNNHFVVAVVTLVSGSATFTLTEAATFISSTGLAAFLSYKGVLSANTGSLSWTQSGNTITVTSSNTLDNNAVSVLVCWFLNPL